MNTLKRSDQGFGAVEGVLIVVIVALIGGAGWLMYNHHHKAASTKSSTTQTTKTTTPAKNYIAIKEWGVRIPVPSNVTTSDIYYTIKNDGTLLASHKLSAVAPSCDPSGTGSTPFGWIERLTPADYQTALNDSANTGVKPGTELGKYYYAWQVRRANCAGVPGQTGYTEANAMMNDGGTPALDNFPANMPDLLKGIEATSN